MVHEESGKKKVMICSLVESEGGIMNMRKNIIIGAHVDRILSREKPSKACSSCALCLQA
ncbi:hypothetical protein [Roseovarius sp.]|uniref:hypothetical protein n=1 Tax=Roseovarius sp. TaxID=1486281 RepID=UPI0035635A1B